MNWLIVLIVCAVIGGIIGLLSDDGSGEGGCMGALGGLFVGGSCIVQVVLTVLPILFFFWLFDGC